MLPHTTLSPNLAALDTKIVPLVKMINTIGLPTHCSCEGHGEGSKIAQSPFPMVVFHLDASESSLRCMYRFMKMVGLHNACSRGSNDVTWVIVPREDSFLSLQPRENWYSLDNLHRGVVALAGNLEKMKD